MRFPTLAVAVFTISAFSAIRQAEGTLLIASPAAEETVSGSVPVTGTAAAPGMLRFRVEFAYDPDPTGTWFLIAEGTGPVEDGLLAVWDTDRVSEGDYALRVAAFFPDGSLLEAVTRGIRVRRRDSTASPPPEETVVPFAPDAQPYGPVAAAFPAPTAAVESDLSQAPPSASPLGIAFLSGMVPGILGFVLFWIRSRWLWWKRQRFLRDIRKSGDF
jgi:hypothetical protein